MINNNLKAPYSDQFSIGMRNKVGDWNTSAALTRILSYNGFAFTLGNRYPNGSFWQNGNQPWGNGIPGYGALILGDNGIRTRTTQVLLSAEKPYTKESGWYATFAYTYTRAYQNRDINEHYSFDEATIGQYPFVLSNAAAKHRFVATGSIDAPYGITLSGKLTLATPMPDNNVLCNVVSGSYFPNGANCNPIGYAPPGTGKFLIGGKVFGYRDIDVAAQKYFNLPGNTRIYVKLSVLNLFNWENFADYSTLNNASYNNYAVEYTKTGNIVFVPRTLKLQVGMDF